MSKLTNLIPWLVALCFSLQVTGCRSTKETSDWRIVKSSKQSENDWVISARSVAGTSMLEYKIEGEVPETPLNAIDGFRQEIIDLATEDQEQQEYPVYDLLVESEDKLVTYVIHNEPFIFKDTEMAVGYVFYDDEVGHAGVTWREAWSVCPTPESKKLKRVEIFRGSWEFSPASDSTSHALNSVQFDPKNVPMWLAEPMVLKFLINGMEERRSQD